MPPGGLNVNQRNVATSLNTFFNSGGALPPDFVTVFGLTGTALTSGADAALGRDRHRRGDRRLPQARTSSST